MKIIHIFGVGDSEEGVWSVWENGEIHSEFDRFFDLINDVEWLHDFFENNSDDLDSGFFENMTTAEAVLKTVDEAALMEDILLNYAKQGSLTGVPNLQHLFKPLNNGEYTIAVHQKSKARIKRGWLRLYAIRLAQNCYLVTGGAIKLTRHMRREHLQQELRKLERTKQFLRNEGIDYPEDLNLNHYYDE